MLKYKINNTFVRSISMNWEFNLPVKLVFGTGKRHNIKEYIDEIGGRCGVQIGRAHV